MGCGLHFIPSLVGPTKSRRLREARGKAFLGFGWGGGSTAYRERVAVKGVMYFPRVHAYKVHVVDSYSSLPTGVGWIYFNKRSVR